MNRSLCALATAVALTALATGCDTSREPAHQAGGTLTVTASSDPTFVDNFNIFSPVTQKQSPGGAFVYEPLLAADHVKSAPPRPWLATAYAFSDGGRTLTFTLRKGVKWSDGKTFSSADVKYTLDLPLHKKVVGSAPYTSVEAPDADTVVVHYAKPSYGDLSAFAGGRLIVPEHVWSKQDPKTWTNKQPVGTGPMTVRAFSPQEVTLSMRDDYWGGRSKGVTAVKIVAAADLSDIYSRLLGGKLDISTAGWPDVQKEYVAKDPEHHLFNFYPTGASAGVVFNTKQAPYNDVHVRRALRAAADPGSIARVMKIGYQVPSATGLSTRVFGGMLAPEYAEPMTQNADEAKKELAAGGWKVVNGKLVKGGKSYALEYAAYQPYAEWVSEGQLLADQWHTVLGLKVPVKNMADQAFTQAETNGELGMFSGNPAGTGSIADAYAMYRTSNYVPVGKPAAVNFGRFDDPAMQKLADESATIDPSDTAALRAQGVRLQRAIVEQAPFIPLAEAGWKAIINTTKWTGFPAPGSGDYIATSFMNTDQISTVLNIRPVS